ncbi:MAG: peptide chain release factor N(5)-glutamine methyltransferase [Lachnospiraceae bacterium]|nr:peptide chain release factor N(5)-glutamine methyltransferase [Lachnospiraceae bacterium]
MTYQEALRYGQIRLIAAGVLEVESDAWLLMSAVCRIDRNFYYVYGNEEMIKEQEKEYMALLEKRAERIPLQYITGEQDFMGLNFKVNPGVLIPRQDTETLVEEVLKAVTPGMEVLDLCTGSGCIAVSLAKFVPGAKVQGVDISPEALKVSEENARRNGVNVHFFLSDMFGQVEGKFDVIVSNPPYIPTGEIQGLMPEVKDFEPHLALDGKEDGLWFYRILAGEGKKYLKPKGTLMVEIGCDQGKDVSRIFKDNGYCDIKVIKDLAGLDRVVTGKDERHV